MISVEEALSHLFSLVDTMDSESVPLENAAGRILIEQAVAKRDQPPFDASAMDGYAVRSTEAKAGARFKVIGEAAAGHGFGDEVGLGEAVRIFTGASVPEGADQVIIQEDITRSADTITINEAPGKSRHIRAKGADFKIGADIAPPKRLRPPDIALLAAMNIPRVKVARKPTVALISTGDELVLPGEDPGPNQIIASNTFGLKALLEDIGAEARILPIARDNIASLETAFGLADGVDLIVTIGGASVGDHDLVGKVAESLGMKRVFYKVRMRPGKPLMAGRLGSAAMVGLPGNPVSAMVCGHVFLAPMVRKMLGLGAAATPRRRAQLAIDLDESGPREHYMRAEVTDDGQITPEPRQDSALLSVLAQANALMIRPAGDTKRHRGEWIEYLPI